MFQRIQHTSALREDLLQVPEVRQRDRRTDNFPGEEVLEVGLQRRVGAALAGHALDHDAVRGLGVVLHDLRLREELLAQLHEGLALLDDVVERVQRHEPDGGDRDPELPVVGHDGVDRPVQEAVGLAVVVAAVLDALAQKNPRHGHREHRAEERQPTAHAHEPHEDEALEARNI